jgi:hypothetical protein
MFCPTCRVPEPITSRMRSRNFGRSGIQVAYTRSLMYPQKKKSSGVISGKRRGPRDWSVAPNPTIREGSHEGFSNVQTTVCGSPILLVDDVWLQIHYLGIHELFQHVKVTVWVHFLSLKSRQTRTWWFLYQAHRLHTLATSFVAP